VPGDWNPAENAQRLLIEALDAVLGQQRPKERRSRSGRAAPRRSRWRSAPAPGGRQSRSRRLRRPAARFGQRHLRRTRHLPCYSSCTAPPAAADPSASSVTTPNRATTNGAVGDRTDRARGADDHCTRRAGAQAGPPGPLIDVLMAGPGQAGGPGPAGAPGAAANSRVRPPPAISPVSGQPPLDGWGRSVPPRWAGSRPGGCGGRGSSGLRQPPPGHPVPGNHWPGARRVHRHRAGYRAAVRASPPTPAGSGNRRGCRRLAGRCCDEHPKTRPAG
jgi:hypothetical protein